MTLKHVMNLFDIMDDINVDGESVKKYLQKFNEKIDIHVSKITDEEGSTDFVKVIVPGSSGRMSGGNAPTLGIVGRLGGIGARPEMAGFVSDGDGALAVMSAAAKLLDMQNKGDTLTGDVILTTHICPKAPTQPHDPVPFMGSPVSIETMNKYEVTDEMEAILSIDTTKGNRIINHRGFAITPTVKEGYILKVSDDLLDIYERATGILPKTMPITTQDITPYGNDIFHINSILQPAVASNSPVVGVALTTETAVAGCGTGASHMTDIESAGRFAIEVAKEYGQKKCSFYNEQEFKLITKLYGSMSHLQAATQKKGAQ